jgi:hypothetical protein
VPMSVFLSFLCDNGCVFEFSQIIRVSTLRNFKRFFVKLSFNYFTKLRLVFSLRFKNIRTAGTSDYIYGIYHKLKEILKKKRINRFVQDQEISCS